MSPDEVAQRLDELALEVPEEFSTELLGLSESLIGAMEELERKLNGVGGVHIDGASIQASNISFSPTFFTTSVTQPSHILQGVTVP